MTCIPTSFTTYRSHQGLSVLLVGSQLHCTCTVEVHVYITAFLVPYKMVASMRKSYTFWCGIRSYAHTGTQSMEQSSCCVCTACTVQIQVLHLAVWSESAWQPSFRMGSTATWCPQVDTLSWVSHLCTMLHTV